jgi:hypothetical protein
MHLWQRLESLFEVRSTHSALTHSSLNFGEIIKDFDLSTDDASKLILLSSGTQTASDEAITSMFWSLAFDFDAQVVELLLREAGKIPGFVANTTFDSFELVLCFSLQDRLTLMVAPYFSA